jgi:hypothetical protein
MFSAIGSVSGRVFSFGGKDYKSKALLQKSFEVVWNAND